MFCLIHRWKIDRALDEGQPLAPTTQSHLKHCGPCRNHHTTQDRLVQRLAQPAPTPEAPPFLQARIMNELRAHSAASQPTESSVPVWIPVAACVLIAFFLYPRPTPPAPPTPPVAEVQPVQQELPLVELPEINVAKALESAHEAVASPYDRELQHLQNDLQAAGAYFSRLIPVQMARNE